MRGCGRCTNDSYRLRISVPDDPRPHQNRENCENERSEQSDAQVRTDPTAWCSCGQCRPQEDEFVCCRQLDEVAAVCDEEPADCITQHGLFPVMCLYRKQLEARSRLLRQEQPMYMDRCEDSNHHEYSICVGS